ncbi:MAG: type I-B CRISPR-associated protein Cas7/Cst2/DevR [Candidatus Woesearchaeota archaeon]
MNEEIKEDSKTEEKNYRKYIVMDIVFHASSLNYDQGHGNFQELKKITKWDGRQYTLVSRYALRYSILHWANKLHPDTWKLAGKDELEAEKEGVASPKINIIEDKKILDYSEFDLFGFMAAKKKENKNKKDEKTYTRVSPVKISHAISLTPFNFDNHFTANLDNMKRAGGEGSNPVNLEEKKDFYIYSVVIDVDRVGKYLLKEHGNDKIGDIDKTEEKNTRIKTLIETLLCLKREIKGRLEDLSPWLMICGLYRNGNFNTFLDRIELSKNNIYKIITKTKEIVDSEGRKVIEIENEVIESNPPKFIIYDTKELTEIKKEDLLKKIDDFLQKNIINNEIFVFKRKGLEVSYKNE